MSRPMVLGNLYVSLNGCVWVAKERIIYLGEAGMLLVSIKVPVDGMHVGFRWRLRDLFPGDNRSGDYKIVKEVTP